MQPSSFHASAKNQCFTDYVLKFFKLLIDLLIFLTQLLNTIISLNGNDASLSKLH